MSRALFAVASVGVLAAAAAARQPAVAPPPRPAAPPVVVLPLPQPLPLPPQWPPLVPPQPVVVQPVPQQPWVPPSQPPPVPQPIPPPLFPLPIVALIPLWLIVVYQQQQEQARQLAARQDEEENRTPYTARDLMEEWEFKIVRCAHPAFVRAEFLAAFLAQEAVAGWELVEVFDAQRVRLKRPVSRRAGDAALPPGTEPYRLYVTDPVADAARARAVSRGLWVGCGLCAVPAAAAAAYAVSTGDVPATVLAGIFGVLALLLGVLAWRRGRAG